MAKILAFSFFPANLPPRSGGEIRLFALYEALSHHHDVTLLTSGELGGALQTFQYNPRFREIRVPKSHEFAETWARLAPVAGSGDLSGPCLAAASSRPCALHDAYLTHHPLSDVIIHDSPFTIGYDLFAGFDGKPRIYNSYNVEQDLYRQLHCDAKADQIPELVMSWERQIIECCDLVTACTDDDLKRFAELYDAPKAAMLLPNGVDAFQAPTVAPAGNRLVFIGSAHRPNQTAAAQIVNVLAPAFPDHVFDIIGRCCEPGQPARNIRSHGMVDDTSKARLLGDALACINPMLEGGGSSLKIPDMAAHGVPIISTDLGARGFDLVAGLHYSRIDPDDPVASVRSALGDHGRLAAQAMAAAEHFSQNFTWPGIAGKLAKRIDALMVERRESSDRPRVVVLNDYDPIEAVGGGGTRIRGLYQGASEQIQPLILSFVEGQEIARRPIFDGKGLAIGIPKTREHCEHDMAQAAEFHVSTADIVSQLMAPRNTLLMAVFQATEHFVGLVACEHPYMATMLVGSTRKFVYSSQNFETNLKRQLLAYHPRREELLANVASIERFCVGCSELILAVSDNDAESFAAEHDLVAPVLVVSNGAEDVQRPDGLVPLLNGFNVCFLGSGHLPNHQAVRFLIEDVAPHLPDVMFQIAGSVCEGFDEAPANVRLLGRLDDADKTLLLMRCQLALNPMEEGSGSNVKMADYLRHGLPVLSTPFGARGYDGLDEDDLKLVPLADFVSAIVDASQRDFTESHRDARQDRFRDRFSMSSFGQDYGAILRELRLPRRRALYVTYRFNAPPRGGGEHYVNRLVGFLAAAGIDIDVLTPKVDRIVDTDRFASDYPAVGRTYPVPFAQPQTRVAKLDVAPMADRAAQIDQIWAQQPAFEEALYRHYMAQTTGTGPTWGWSHGDGNGRWALAQFGLHGGEAGRWRISGESAAEYYLVLRGEAGQHLLGCTVSGRFECEFDAPAGSVAATLFRIAGDRPLDPRRLGIYVTQLQHDGTSLLAQPALQPWQAAGEPLSLFHAMHQAARGTRFQAGASLAELRGPYCPDLEAYLARHTHEYDLVITHNAVFRTASVAVAAANAAGVPSLIVPHAHFEDDYYHFPDVMTAIANASRALVTPRLACRFLTEIGMDNVEFLSPGIDGDEDFSAEDEAEFAARYPRKGPFVLVAGRKAAAKGYREVIAATAQVRTNGYSDLRVVIIGPDDDGEPITEDFVDYLGMVERPVLRGAYRACSMLANMSRSESFGIVLLEAGLAARPVVANNGCAAFMELVADGRNGFLTTPARLAERLAAVMADPVRASAMGKAGREMALEYDWSRIGSAFVNHCTQLMNTRKVSAK
jgi:glycosyltransferase involved in cell wall biosynthesis